MGGKYSPCLKWYITVSYVSNVNGLKKHTQRLSTVQHSAPSPSCPLPFVPTTDKPPVHHRPSLAALQSPCLQQTLCKRAKLPEIQLQDLSFQLQALYKSGVTPAPAPKDLTRFQWCHIWSIYYYFSSTTSVKKKEGAEGQKPAKYLKFKNNT